MYDAIVIGGGLGGLVAGARLSKTGKKVLLLEQHYVPGGCATVFKRKEFTFEVGLHEMDGLDRDDIKNTIFKELGIDQNLELLKVPELYRFVNERINMVVPDGVEKAKEALFQKFPHEKKGIDKFFKVILSISRDINRLPQNKFLMLILLPIFPLVFPYLVFNMKKTLGQLLDSIIQDEDLKLVLCANLLYYHDDPYTMSLIYYSAAQGSYFKGGGHFIKGGSQELSNYLANYIEKHGGKVQLRTLVEKILIEKEKVKGVEYSQKNGKIKDKVFTDIVIANASPLLIKEMLPEKEKNLLNQKLKGLQPACSLMNIYVGLNKNLKKELDSHFYSTFFMPNEVKTLKDIKFMNQGNKLKRGFVLVDYSQLDSALCPEDKTVCSFCLADYLKDWEKLSDEEYKKEKEEVAQNYFNEVEKHIPGFKAAIEYYEVATAKTIQRYTKNPFGTAYGFAQTPEQTAIKRLANKSSIPGLYFASAWANPGGGFTGAILSGWFCANEILKR